MTFKTDNSIKAVVICHGKSELYIMNHIKSKLRIPIKNYAKDKGNKPIEISSINSILNGRDFQSKSLFLQKYSNIKEERIGKKKGFAEFKLFIVLDVDHTSAEDVQRFKDRSMFKDHFLYDYIHPILNDNNLEEVLNDIGYTYAKTDKQKKEYKKLFPAGRGEQDIDRIEEFREALSKTNKSNLDELLEYCIKHCPRF